MEKEQIEKEGERSKRGAESAAQGHFIMIFVGW